MLAIAVGLLLVISGPLHPTQATLARSVEGVLVVAPDAAKLKEVKKRFTYGMPYKEFKAKFSEDKYVVVEWGRRSAIVIDKTIGRYDELSRALNSARVLIDRAGEGGVVSIGSLSPTEREQLLWTMREPSLHPEGFNIDKAKVGLTMHTNVTITEPGGRSRVFPMPLQNEFAKRQKNELKSAPVYQRPPKDESEQKQHGSQLEEQLESTRKYQLEALGVAQANLAEGMEQLGAEMRKLDKQFADERGALAAEVLKKLGLSGPPLAGSGMTFQDLPESMRDLMLRSLAGDWQNQGYSSQAEAESAIRNATFGVRTSFIVHWSTDSGGPMGSFHGLGHQLFDVPGGIAP
jgi:hypothetical protein